jgi:hypothetical protein
LYTVSRQLAYGSKRNRYLLLKQETVLYRKAAMSGPFVRDSGFGQ